jgi:CrcB protein
VNPVVLVGLGGVAGALARHLLGERIDRRTYDTLAVNVVGSFLLGVLTAGSFGTEPTLAFGTGFCGAFTTFSTFAFETARLAEEGRTRRAALNGATNLLGALLAVGIGAWVAALL